MPTTDTIPAGAAGADADVGGSEPLFNPEALQRAIFNSATFSCIAVDAGGVIRIFNVGAQRMLGYSAAEVIGRMTVADLHDPQEVAVRAAALRDEFSVPIAPGFEALVFKATRGIEDIYELTKVRKDGSRFPAVVSVTALRDVQGAIIGYLLIGTDNTVRQDAEAVRVALDHRLRDLEYTLEQNQIQRESDAAHASEMAIVNQELEAFSYSVSHDLRAPLRHIHGYVQMLQRVTDGQLPEKAVRYLKTITDASEEMGQLIDDLLAFSRVGRTEVRKTAVELGQLVQEVIRSLEMATTERHLVWQIAPLPTVVGDPSLLKQVFVNLVDNALKYSRPRDPATIEIGCAGEEGAYVVLFVRDNGVGFDMQYAHKLFGVFQRLHRPEEFEGTGIGLAIVRRIVTRHGGRVWAESAIDRGATIYFSLERSVSAESGAGTVTA